MGGPSPTYLLTYLPLQGCTALHELDLYGNQLTGSLEPLQQCTELTGFDVRGNQLTGGL